MTRLLTTFTAFAIAGALMAGCGDDDTGGAAGGGGGGDYGGGGAAPAKTATTTESAAGGSGGALTIAADETDGLKFDKDALTADAGKVTITMDNPAADKLPHAVAVEGEGVDQDGAVAQPGGTSTVSLDLKPGTYTFYCPVGSHREAGMEGTLTVR